MYSNNLPDDITSGNTEMFADDTTPYGIADTYDEAFLLMHEIISQVDRWATKNMISIHPSKSKIMFISRINFIGPYPLFSLKDHQPIEVVQSIKCLGLVIDNKLTWSNHVAVVSKRYRAKFKKLYELWACNEHHLKSIYFKGILPAVLYCIAVWGSCNNSTMQTLENIHIRAARFICRIKKSIPDTNVLEACNWQPLQNYYKRRLACISYNIFHKIAPEALTNLLEKIHQ